MPPGEAAALRIIRCRGRVLWREETSDSCLAVCARRGFCYVVAWVWGWPLLTADRHSPAGHAPRAADGSRALPVLHAPASRCATPHRSRSTRRSCLANISFVAEQLAVEAGHGDVEKVGGLRGFLESCSLSLALRQAEGWCNEQGFDNLADIVEVGMEQEFVAELGELKPGKRQLVLKRLASWGA